MGGWLVCDGAGAPGTRGRRWAWVPPEVAPCLFGSDELVQAKRTAPEPVWSASIPSGGPAGVVLDMATCKERYVTNPTLGAAFRWALGHCYMCSLDMLSTGHSTGAQPDNMGRNSELYLVNNSQAAKGADSATDFDPAPELKRWFDAVAAGDAAILNGIRTVQKMRAVPEEAALVAGWGRRRARGSRRHVGKETPRKRSLASSAAPRSPEPQPGSV